jgi:hypothetical protein
VTESDWIRCEQSDGRTPQEIASMRELLPLADRLQRARTWLKNLDALSRAHRFDPSNVLQPLGPSAPTPRRPQPATYPPSHRKERLT